MKNEHELENCVQPQGNDAAGITKTKWHGSLNWSIAMERYRFFRKAMLGR